MTVLAMPPHEQRKRKTDKERKSNEKKQRGKKSCTHKKRKKERRDTFKEIKKTCEYMWLYTLYTNTEYAV